ncbi:MAG: DUF3365 domain-containing protein [Raoultibacter sp.]
MIAIRKNRHVSIGLKTKILGLLAVMFCLLLAVDVIWTFQVQKEKTKTELLEQSRVLVTEMDAVWQFISINQDRINYTSDGKFDYKSLHCAIVGKSVASLFSLNSDYSIRFANLTPRNISNSPDEYEAKALNAFYADSAQTEQYGFEEEDGESVFRYVSAMKVSENCIQCHGKPAGQTDVTGYPKEGWELGDVAGAVSVVVPTRLYFDNLVNTVANNALFFLILMVFMMIIIYFVLSRLIINPLTNLRDSLEHVGGRELVLLDKRPVIYDSREIEELFSRFNEMAKKLSTLYDGLESLVGERTTQLSEANRELEWQRRKVELINDKLKKENQYKSDFLAIVSHELRTPLTSILAFTELMENNIASDNKLARKQLDEIDKNGRILLEMVNNVLESARIQSGSERLNLELVDLSDVVGMVEASNGSLALKKDIEIITHVDSDVPLIVSDWEKVRRILVNLMSNAIKFTSTGGRVEIMVSYLVPDELVRIDVTDNGIGIPRDKQELIFDRFTQENMSTVRRYGGSGLGLSLVKDFSTMLGGEVLVVSDVGEGSTFSVILPTNLRMEDSDD